MYIIYTIIYMYNVYHIYNIFIYFQCINLSMSYTYLIIGVLHFHVIKSVSHFLCHVCQVVVRRWLIH